MLLNKISADVRFTLRSWIARYPAAYFALLHLSRSPRRHLYVRRDTEVVIEGYPRSANTFAVCAFLYAQARPVKIARHLHLPVQISRAVKWKIPTMIVLRKPEDAILSYLVRYPALSAKTAVNAYIDFYRTAEAFRNYLTLVAFDTVTHDFGAAIKALNLKFNTNFQTFVPSSDALQEVYRMIDEMDQRDTRQGTITVATVARPIEGRAQLKQERHGELRACPTLCQADELYDRLSANLDA